MAAETLTASQVVHNALSRHPDRIAFYEDDREWTYRETLELIKGLMSALSSNGIGAGCGLAVLSSNRPEVWALQEAIQSLGGYYTPLHPLSGLEEHLRVLEHSEAKALVITAATLGEYGQQIQERLPSVKVFNLDGADDLDIALLASKSLGAVTPPVCGDGESVALVGYTGGTTGVSKGIERSQRRLLATIQNLLLEWPFPRVPVTIVCTPMTHMGGSMIAPTIVKGGSVVLREKFAVEDFCGAVQRYRVNTTFLVPTVIYRLLDGAQGYDLSSLQMIGYGSAPMSPTRLAEALNRFGQVFVQGYGGGEQGGCVIVLKQEDHLVDLPDLLASAGTPGNFVDIALFDDDDSPVPDGQPGEICVRGPMTMERYWRNPEETAKVVRDGWVHSGDIGVRNSEGYIFLVDRKKDMIISGGFNVYPKEIENVLATDGRVSACAVIGVPHDTWGEQVHAFVTLKAGVEASDTLASELLDLVRAEKGKIHTPKEVHFADTLPCTAVGKIDKRALRAQYWGHLTRNVN